MPPKFLFTRDQMITAALELTRAGGLSAVTARGLAAKLGCSVKPIFGLFENMEEVQREVLLAAHQCYLDKLHQSMAAGGLPSLQGQRHGLHSLCPGGEGAVSAAVHAGSLRGEG